jgi:hypothetical protein
VDDVHEAMPDVPSVPEKLTATEWLNHVPWSGERAVVPVTAGGVASYLTAYDPDELFPALSVQVTLALVPTVSGPLYVVDVQELESTPESESVPVPEIFIGVRYQPAELAGLSGTADVTGAPVSNRTVNVAADVFPALSVQLPLSCVPAVSGPL